MAKNEYGIHFNYSVVRAFTEFLGKKSHRQVGMDRVIATGSLCSVTVSTLVLELQEECGFEDLL